MKALILAAGFGSRLMPITENLPKSLVKVNGKPILFKQIENLISNGISDITVVSGYKGEVLKEEVNKAFPFVKIIYSKDYETTNNMYSAYLGISDMGESEFLMMNADVFFDGSVIKALLDFDYPDAVVTDIGNYLEESMKVTEKNGYLKAISKTISKEDALGCSIDVYKFSVRGGQAFYDKCKEYIETKKELKLWSEVALNDIFDKVNFKACPLKGRWFEIDNHDDLAAAEKLFGEHC